MNQTNRTEIRRKALLAAASVTLALWMPACTAADKASSTDDTDGAADTDVNTLDTSVASDTDHATDTDLRTDTDHRTDTDVGAKPDCVEEQLDMNTCCESLRDWCGVTLADDTDTTAYDECVFGPDFSGSTGCIPWGPPVPPAARVA